MVRFPLFVKGSRLFVAKVNHSAYEFISLSEVLTGLSGTSTVGTSDSSGRSFGSDEHVGELTVVGRTERIAANEVQRVGIRMVTSLERNNRSVEEGIDEGEATSGDL